MGFKCGQIFKLRYGQKSKMPNVLKLHHIRQKIICFEFSLGEMSYKPCYKSTARFNWGVYIGSAEI
jgi:hypothetical protein